MPVTNSEKPTTAGSQQAVAAGTSNVVSQKRFPGNFTLLAEGETGSLSGISNSFLPANVGHNDNASLVLVEGLRQAVTNASQESLKPRLRSGIPTADFITTSSFKTGAKMLIKVEPSNGNNRFNDYKGVLTFDKFSLQTIAEVDDERYQLQETFEDFVLFSFGRRPRIWTFQGVVMNGPSDRNINFADELISNYEEYYRATKTTEQDSVAYITYEDIIVEGTLVSLNVVRNAQNPALVNVSLTVVIHDRNVVGQALRDGVENMNIANIMETTGNVDPATGRFVDVRSRVRPQSIIKAQPNSNDLRSRVGVAQGDLQASQEKVADLGEQRAAAADAVAEAEARESDAAVAETQALQDKAAAEAAVADPGNPTPEEQGAIDQATGEVAQAQQDQTEARAAGQAATVAQEDLDEQIANEDASQQDLIAEAETLVSTAESATDSPFQDDEVLCATRFNDALDRKNDQLRDELRQQGFIYAGEITGSGSGTCDYTIRLTTDGVTVFSFSDSTAAL